MPAKHPGRYLAGGLVVLLAWTAVAVALLSADRVDANGPLSLNRPQLRAALPGGLPPERLLALCFPPARRTPSHYYKVVGGTVDGRVLQACYELDEDGWVLQAKVLDADGLPVQDVGALKHGGAWPWVGQLNSGTDVVGAVLLGAATLLLLGALMAGERPPWAADPGRRWLLARRLGLVVVVLAANRSLLLTLRWPADPLGLAGALLPIVTCAYAIAAGRLWLVGPPSPAVPTAPAGQAAPAPVEAPPAAGPELDGQVAERFELTRRELDVLRLIAAGHSNAEIAGLLFVSETTVKSHVGRLLAKLGCANRTQAAMFAREHGLAGDRP